MERKEKIKLMSLKELADLYGVHTSTMRRYISAIKHISHKPRKLYTPKEIKLIYETIGEP